MRDWIIGQGVIIYVFAGSLLVGLVSAFIANHGYKKYIRESEIMGNTQNRLLKYIKLKYGSYYKLNMRPQDSRALTKHYLYKCRVGFFNILTWINVSRFAAGVIAVAVLVNLMWQIHQGLPAGDMITMVCWGLIAIGLLYIQRRLYDFPEKRNMLEWYLMDYLENFLKNKIESGQSGVAATAALEGGMENGEGYRPGRPETTSFEGTGSRHEPIYDTGGTGIGDRREPGHDAAAAKAPDPASRRIPGQSYGQSHAREDDDLDARIVSDILKEFL